MGPERGVDRGGDRGTVAVIGDEVAVSGYVLAGAVVLPADDAAAVRSRWSELGAGVSIVLLTSTAASVLAAERGAVGAPLSVVIPT